MESLSMLTLSCLDGLTNSKAHQLLEEYGTAEAALSDDAPSFSFWRVLKQDRAAMLAARARAEQELEFCEKHQISVLPISSKSYPRVLKSRPLKDLPLQLFFRGNVTLQERHILSIVGTRRITEYGKQLCESFIEELSRYVPDLLVVSGLAYGVDIHAHRACLSCNLPTVAVLAHGLDRIYPPLHRETAVEITEHGGLLTEYMSGTVPDKGNFVRRNRIVAGMSHATLVIESANRGGALITAGIANTFAATVFAVPGRVTDLYSAGCNKLISENAAMAVTSGKEVAVKMGWASSSDKVEKGRSAEPQLFTVLTEKQEQVMAVIRQNDTVSRDGLCMATGLSIQEVNDVLFDLEDYGMIAVVPGNNYRVKG